MQHLKWCYLPSTCKALPALAAAQDSLTSVHTPHCSHENFTPMQRQPRKPTSLQGLQTLTSGPGFKLGSDIYSVGLFLWLLYNIAAYNQTEKYGRTWKGNNWYRKIRAMCIQADMKRSKHRTQQGLQQGCRSTTPCVSITAAICSLS